MQAGAERLDRSVKMTLDRAGTHPEHGADLVDREVLIEAKHHALTLAERKRTDGVPYRMVGSSVLNAIIRDRAGMSPFENDATETTVPAVDHCLSDIRVEPVAVAEKRGPSDELHENVVHDFFRVRAIADEPFRQTDEVARSRSVQLLDLVA